MKKLLVCLCFLALLTPPEARADLLWQHPFSEPIDFSISEVLSGENSIETEMYEAERTMTLQRFDPNLGKLETGWIDFNVYLDPFQKTEAWCCRWDFISNEMVFPSHYDYEYNEWVGSIPRFTGIDPSSGTKFSTIYPPFPGQLSGTLSGSLRIAEACPTFPHFVDYCTIEADEYGSTYTHREDLDIDRFTGVGPIDYEFYTGFYLNGGAYDPVDCDPCYTVEVLASLEGYASMRALYVFSPAVDVFVSTQGTNRNNVLRYRSDGQDVSREVFISPGAGGLEIPHGLVFTPEGDLLVASWTPYPPSSILRYDGQTGEFLGVFSNHEQLSGPINMVYGPDGDLYVLVQRSYPLQLRERVLRFDGQTGEFLGVFAREQCGYTNPSCELDGAMDLAFGPFGDLYVTAHTTEQVVRFDGSTGELKDIFIDNLPGLKDIVWPENSASLFLLYGDKIREYKIHPDSRLPVPGDMFNYYMGSGAAIGMGQRMRFGTTELTAPSLFEADQRGLFHYSPPRPYTEYQMAVMGIVSAWDIVVRPHVLQTISRPINPGDIDLDFGYAGLGVSVHFSEVTASGTLGLTVSELAPGQAPGYTFLNRFYEFTFHDGLSYTGPVELCFDIPPGTDAANAQIMRWNGSDWESPISSSVTGNVVCATFSSLSWFGIALNQTPTSDPDGPYSGNEGSPVSFDGTGSSDPDGDTLTYEWNFGDGTTDTGSTPTHTYADNGDYEVCLTASDSNGGVSTECTDVHISNVAPDVGAITAPMEPVQVGTSINASAAFTDPGTADTHTAVWDWGDGFAEPGSVTQGAGSGSVADSHTYTTPGVYTIMLTVTDDDDGAGTSVFQFVVVYDPSGGFVTGGGWINSPAGAYVPDLSLAGRATFGFVSKYKRGASTPTGNTEFQFHAGDMNFHSDSYDWLVIAGHKAMYKGTGTINGVGNYGFMLSAIDEKLTPSTDVDLFRIKIWDKDAGDAVVYENQIYDADDADPTTAIGGGSIVIHKAKK